MRKCSVCKIEKELDEFHKKGKGHSYMCKECRKEYIREHYQNNKSKYVDKAKKATIKAKVAFHEMKSKLKCSKCGENHPGVLDFHHVNPSDKEGNISKFLKSGRKLKEEINKCIVLCSNCHRKLHYEETHGPIV